MESARRHFLEGKMTEEEYRRKACIETILALEDEGYFLEGQLGVGTFGVIVELVNRAFRQKVAAKIVLQEYVTEIEKKLWPLIEHQNVLALNDMLYIPETYCYVFFMDKQTVALDKLLDEPSFTSDVHNFKRSMTWLRGIVEGIKYLHDKKLGHLDLKLGNVLITKSDTAKICDFGSLTKTEGAADSYQSPFLYRAPEGLVSENGEQAVVDAFRYDIYSLGILSLELFTNQALYKSFTDDWTDSNPSWTDVMYPRIYDVLQVKRFKDLVKNTFAHTKIKDQTIEIMRDFVRGCISLNPKNRPSINDVLQHKMFGGHNLFLKKKNDIWINKEVQEQFANNPCRYSTKRVQSKASNPSTLTFGASRKKVQFLLSLYVGCAASLRLPPTSHTVFESGDVQESIKKCILENPVEMKGDDIIPETTKKTSILKSIRHWFGGKWDKYCSSRKPE